MRHICRMRLIALHTHAQVPAPPKGELHHYPSSMTSECFAEVLLLPVFTSVCILILHRVHHCYREDPRRSLSLRFQNNTIMTENHRSLDTAFAGCPSHGCIHFLVHKHQTPGDIRALHPSALTIASTLSRSELAMKHLYSYIGSSLPAVTHCMVLCRLP